MAPQGQKITGFAGFSRYPAGLVYWGKGYKSMAYVTGDHTPSPKPPSRLGFSRCPTINGLRYL